MYLLLLCMTLTIVFQHISATSFEMVRAQKADLPAIQQLLQTTLHPTFNNYIPVYAVDFIIEKRFEDVSNNIDNPNYFIVIAKNNDEIMGIICFVQHDQCTLHMGTMYINPAFQHQGIGTQLLNQWKVCMPHAQKIQAYVAEKNLSAQQFYKKHGFLVVGKEEYAIGDHQGILLIIEKKL